MILAAAAVMAAVRVGIGKTKDIAGIPVNVTSKMAQDKDEFGKLYVNIAKKC